MVLSQPAESPKAAVAHFFTVRIEICARPPPPESRLIFLLDSDIHLIVYLLVALLT
jgi:hypothetical protein